MAVGRVVALNKFGQVATVQRVYLEGEVLIGAQVVNAIVGPAGTVVAMLGLHRAATFVYLFTAAFGAALLLILVPALGIDGAAIAVVVTTALWGIALNVLLYRRVGTTVWIGRIRRGESSG